MKLACLFISITFLTGCSTTIKKFGKVLIDNTTDTASAKQAIFNIRHIDNDVFEAGTFVDQAQIEVKYRLFKPAQGKAADKYPLVVVYHGSGAVVTDNTAQLGLLQKLFASPEVQHKYPAYVLAPQFPTRSSDYAMDTNRNLLYSIPRPCLNSVLQLIDSLK